MTGRRCDDVLRRYRVTLRTSPRARRMRLVVRPPHEAQLVVPRGVPLEQRNAFLYANLEWLAARQADFERRYRGDRSPVPARVDLPALERQWNVVMRAEAEATLRVTGGGSPALILNSSEPTQVLRQALRSWLVVVAREAFGPWLARESRRLQLDPSRLLVRLQRTRWGSCSARGTISLNARALFLAPEVVRYLLVHELCHLQDMTHSRRFWALVERFEPDYRRLGRSLTEGWALIPAWAASA